MQIVVNGENKEVKAANVADLISELGLGGKAVAVEHNRRVVPRRDHEDTPLAEGDRVELVTLVGGG